MKELTTEETKNYNGGAIKFTAGITIIISGLTAFLLGLVDGMTNPKSCNR